MKTYNVYVFREMRVRFPGIVAETAEEAARLASAKLTTEAECVEDCDGLNLSALVDVAGDEEYNQSRLFDFCRECGKPTGVNQEYCAACA